MDSNALGTIVTAVLGVLLLCIAGVLGAVVTYFRASSRMPEPAETLQLRVAELEMRVAALPSLWDTERMQAEAALKQARSEHAKARAARSAAERARGESDELDADEDVHGGDGGSGAAQGVLPMHRRVEGSPGAEPDHMDRARALGYPFSFMRH